MSRNLLVASIAIVFLFSLAACQSANAQSGSRNRSSSSQSRWTVSPQQQAQLRQQTVLQQQRNIALQRKQALQQVVNNPNSQFNKNQFLAAFKDAKAEFMAIHSGRLEASGRNLNRIFVLRSKEFNRNARNIKWPKALLAEPHRELTEVVDGIVAGEVDATQLDAVLLQLNQQIEQRVVAKSIKIKDYANAKRFVSGLANEAML